MAHFASANRDECVFANADTFDSDRRDLGLSQQPLGQGLGAGRRQ